MRCDGVGPDSASSQPVMARASSLRTAISQRDRSTNVTSGRGAPASATMIAPAASHDPAAARVVAEFGLVAVEQHRAISDAEGDDGHQNESGGGADRDVEHRRRT